MTRIAVRLLAAWIIVAILAHAGGVPTRIAVWGSLLVVGGAAFAVAWEREQRERIELDRDELDRQIEELLAEADREATVDKQKEES